MLERQKVQGKNPSILNRIQSIYILKLGYVFALSFIAILTVTTWLMVHSIIQTQTYSAAQVNISGRQRMLSQEIAFHGLQLVNTPDPEEREILRTKLNQAIVQMKVNHKGLVEGNPSLNLPPPPLPFTTYAMYYEAPLKLEEQLSMYLYEAEALVQTPDSLLRNDNLHLSYILNVRDQFKDHLNQMVYQYQLESEQKVDQLLSLEKKVLTLTLLVLFSEALFIFRPLVNLVQREHRQLEASNVELHNLSSLDGLTGIFNRRTFDQYLEKEWQLSNIHRKSIAIILCDIDHFKAYNDTYGHQQGDDCLCKVAQALRDTVKRKEDLVARYGGEEFVIVLPSTDLNGATSVAEELRLAVASLNLRHEASLVAPYVTVSLGVAVNENNRNFARSSELVKAADEALYQAKSNGRNQIFVS